jgi:hypothetical protein
MNWLDNNNELFGQWRIEVTPGKSDTDDIFLHLLQVGDSSLQSMANSTPLKTEDMVGVRFVHENKEFEVIFSITDNTGGKIMVSKNGQKILEEELSDKVKPQEGLY